MTRFCSFWIVAVLLLLTAFRSAAILTVTGNVYSASAAAATNSVVTFIPDRTLPVVDGNNVYVPRTVTVKATNAAFSSQLVAGGYTMQIDGKNLFKIYPYVGEGIVDFSAILTNATTFASTNAFVFQLRTTVKTNGVAMGTAEWTNLNLIGATGMLANGTATIGGFGGGGGGEVTTAQLNTASNLLFTTLTNYDTITSNGLYSLINAGGITADAGTNIARFFATNSSTITSNALRSLLVSNDTITSNGAVAFAMVVSNAVASLGGGITASNITFPGTGVLVNSNAAGGTIAWFARSSSNNWSAGNDPASRWRYHPDRGFSLTYNYAGHPGYNSNDVSLSWMVESTWFNPGIAPVLERWERFSSPVSNAFRQPFGYDINLDNNAVTLSLAASRINFRNDEGADEAWIMPNQNSFNIVGMQLSFTGNTNEWFIEKSGLGLMSYTNVSRPKLFRGGNGNEKVVFFQDANVLTDNTVEIVVGGDGGLYRGIRWNTTNQAGWELQKWDQSYYVPADKTGVSSSEKVTDIVRLTPPYFGDHIGDTFTLGYLTNSSGGGVSGHMEISVYLYGQVSQKYFISRMYNQYGSAWYECLPLMNNARDGNCVIDIKANGNSTVDVRLRRVEVSSEGPANPMVTIRYFGSDSFIYVPSASTNGTVSGLALTSILTQKTGRVGIGTNAPAAALHVGNGGSAIIDGNLTVNGVSFSSLTNGGGATNAVTVIKTNGVNVGASITSLDFTNGANTTVAAAISGSEVRVTVDATGGGGTGIVTNGGSGTNNIFTSATFVTGIGNSILVTNNGDSIYSGMSFDTGDTIGADVLSFRNRGSNAYNITAQHKAFTLAKSGVGFVLYEFNNDIQLGPGGGEMSVTIPGDLQLGNNPVLIGYGDGEMFYDEAVDGLILSNSFYASSLRLSDTLYVNGVAVGSSGSATTVLPGTNVNSVSLTTTNGTNFYTVNVAAGSDSTWSVNHNANGFNLTGVDELTAADIYGVTTINANAINVGTLTATNGLGPITNNFQPAANALTNFTRGADGISNAIYWSTNYGIVNVATNGSANSNLLWFVGPLSNSCVYTLTNNISVTNFFGLVSGTKACGWIRFIPTGTTRTLVLPTRGAPQFGVLLKTNFSGAGPVFTSLTNGREYVIGWERYETNISVSMTVE